MNLRDPGADPGFQVRGGALKKIATSGGRREHFLGFSNFRGKLTLILIIVLKNIILGISIARQDPSFNIGMNLENEAV
jgi:hypothetical protein